MGISDDKADFLFKILETNLSWISGADSKGAILFTIFSAMLAVTAAMVPPISKWGILNSIISILAIIILLTGIIFVVLSQFPRLKGPRNSLIYFGGISSHDEQDYVDKITNANPNDLVKDLARQCHRNAEIAKSKYAFIKMATICLISSAPFWLLSIWLLYPIKFLSSK